MRTAVPALVAVIAVAFAAPASADPSIRGARHQCFAAGGTFYEASYEGAESYGCFGTGAPPAAQPLCENAFGGTFAANRSGYDCLLPRQGG